MSVNFNNLEDFLVYYDCRLPVETNNLKSFKDIKNNTTGSNYNAAQLKDSRYGMYINLKKYDEGFFNVSYKTEYDTLYCSDGLTYSTHYNIIKGLYYDDLKENYSPSEPITIIEIFAFIWDWKWIMGLTNNGICTTYDDIENLKVRWENDTSTETVLNLAENNKQQVTETLTMKYNATENTTYMRFYINKTLVKSIDYIGKFNLADFFMRIYSTTHDPVSSLTLAVGDYTVLKKALTSEEVGELVDYLNNRDVNIPYIEEDDEGDEPTNPDGTATAQTYANTYIDGKRVKSITTEKYIDVNNLYVNRIDLNENALNDLKTQLGLTT